MKKIMTLFLAIVMATILMGVIPCWAEQPKIDPDGGFQFYSPVGGIFGVVSDFDDCGEQYWEGKWCFCQHKSNHHVPGGGVGGSDDTWAWDINLPDDRDAGETVYAAAKGIVEDTYAGQPNAHNGWVLIRHENKDEGWVVWSAYLHMDDIQVWPGQEVNTGTVLGEIGHVETQANHLHFVVYYGENVPYGLISYNGDIVERGDESPITGSPGGGGCFISSCTRK